MHGFLNSAFCVECGWQGPRHGRLEGNRECPACECDALRPDIVLFVEAPRYMRQIEAALEQCDLFIAIGTSGTVYPAAGYVEIAKASGAQTHQFDIKAPQNSKIFNRCHVGPVSHTVSAWVDEFTIFITSHSGFSWSGNGVRSYLRFANALEFRTHGPCRKRQPNNPWVMPITHRLAYAIYVYV